MTQIPQQRISRPPMEQLKSPTRYQIGRGRQPSSQTTQYEHPTTTERIPRRYQHIQATLPGIPKRMSPQIPSMEIQTTIMPMTLKGGIYNEYHQHSSGESPRQECPISYRSIERT